MKLRIQGEGLEELVTDLTGMSVRAHGPGLRPVFEHGIQPAMLRTVQKNFIAGGRPVRWAGLQPSTIKKRRKKKAGTIQILRDTGQFMESISNSENPGPHAIRRVGDNFAEIGTRLPYPTWLHEGTEHMVARPVAMFQQADFELFSMLILDHITLGELDMTPIVGAP